MRTPLRLAVLVAATWAAPARADDEPATPYTDDALASPRDELVRENGDDPGGPAAAPRDAQAPRKFAFGFGLVPLVWMPANNPFSIRFEFELRWTPVHPWSVIADVSYIQIGETGTPLSEDGIDIFVGGMREWAIGDPSAASFFPHARAGLVFESTSTRRASSAKFVALRAGPGIDWNIVSGFRLNLDLELGLGLLAIKSGSEGDSALFELTLGLAIRALWGFG